MQLLISNYKVQSNQNDWSVAKQKGKQWEVIGYFDTLERAIGNLFDYRVKTETKNFVVDFNDATNIATQKTNLIQKIKLIKEEILEGLK